MCLKAPYLYHQEKPLLTLPEWTPSNPLSTNKNTLFTKKKNSMLRLWTIVYQEANLVAPFHSKKKPRMGYLGVSSFPPLSTTHNPPPAPKQNTERTLTFRSMTLHSLS